MQKKNKIDNSDFIESSILSYFSPLIIGVAIDTLFKGTFYSGVYSFSINGLAAYVFACIVLVFGFSVLYNIFISIPKKYGGWQKVNEIMKFLIASPFLYIFIITIFIKTVLNLLAIQYIPIYYIITLIICLIFQIRFNRKLYKMILG